MSTRLVPPLSAEPLPGGPVPAPPPHTPVSASAPRDWFGRWEADSFTPANSLDVCTGLLRAQGAVARDLMRDRHGARYLGGMLLLALAASALYGAILGSFAGPQQMMFAALKFPVVVLGSCAICLPSFHVFNALMGARVNLMQSANCVMLIAAGAGLILLACAPVVWFFSLSTDDGARGFMVALHVLTLAVACGFGITLIWRVQRYARLKENVRMIDGRVLVLWLGVFLMAAAQFAHYAGPLLSDGELFAANRGFFLTELFRPD